MSGGDAGSGNVKMKVVFFENAVGRGRVEGIVLEGLGGGGGCVCGCVYVNVVSVLVIGSLMRMG